MYYNNTPGKQVLKPNTKCCW